MTAVFADTYYFLALLNPADDGHEAARQFTEKYLGRYLTTTAILLEFADALAHPPTRSIASRFVAGLASNPEMSIIAVEDSLFQNGLTLYGSRADKNWSLTDCISFVAMEQHGLTEALTGDHHFEQAGFTALLR